MVGAVRGEEGLLSELCKNILKRIINAAFGYEQMDEIDLVYPKKIPKTKQDVERMCEKWLTTQVRSFIKTDEFTEINTLEKMFDKFKNNDEDEEENNYYKKHFKQNIDKKATIIDIIMDKKFERDGKLDEINISLDSITEKTA